MTDQISNHVFKNLKPLRIHTSANSQTQEVVDLPRNYMLDLRVKDDFPLKRLFVHNLNQVEFWFLIVKGRHFFVRLLFLCDPDRTQLLGDAEQKSVLKLKFFLSASLTTMESHCGLGHLRVFKN